MTDQPARIRMCNHSDFDKGNLFRHFRSRHRSHPGAMDEEAKAPGSFYENIWTKEDAQPSGTYDHRGCYQCDHCEYTSYDMSELSLHSEKCHKEETKERLVSEVSASSDEGRAAFRPTNPNETSASTETNAKEATSERVTRHGSEKSIKCGYCPVMFYSKNKRSLFDHIREVHGKGRK